MDKVDIRADQFYDAGNVLQKIFTEMQDELQVESWNRLARITLTGGAAADAFHPVPEREIGRLHHFEQSLVAQDFRFGDVSKYRVTFELDDVERRLEALDEQFQQFGEDIARVSQFRPREIGCIAGNISNNKIAVKGLVIHPAL